MGMRSRCAVWAACGLACVLVYVGAPAQTAAVPGAAAQTTEDALHAMSRRAAVIFAGRVVAVRRQDGGNGASGVGEIDFAVDETIRGVSGGGYTLREWAGLWAAGDAPFRVGQHYLMLLHAPSAAGLSSPGDGADGGIPIRGGGSAPAVGAAEASSQSGGDVVDLRWVATRVVRPVSYQVTLVVRGTGRPVAVRPDVVAAGVAQAPESASFPGSEGNGTGVSALPSVAAADSDSQSESVATVIAMLRSWEKEDHATR